MAQVHNLARPQTTVRAGQSVPASNGGSRRTGRCLPNTTSWASARKVRTLPAVVAVGFVLGRIWQIRCDLEQEHADDFTPPTIGRIPTSCATAAGGRLYY